MFISFYILPSLLILESIGGCVANKPDILRLNGSDMNNGATAFGVLCISSFVVCSSLIFCRAFFNPGG